MDAINKFSSNTLFYSSGLGVIRGILVNLVIYPLEVVKTSQQFQTKEAKSHKIALHLFQTEGVSAFYRGIKPQLFRSSLKQIWCWPMITGIPVFLDKHNISPLYQQGLTGLAIATVDAAVTTPFEKARILAITSSKNVSLKTLIQEGWQGVFPNWAKLSVYWSAFLVTQHYLRTKRLEKNNQSLLTMQQLSIIGVKVALVVSLVFTPLDVVNTLKQSQKGLSHLFRGLVIRNFFRGLPLNALSLITHNIASVILIDKLAVAGHPQNHSLR